MSATEVRRRIMAPRAAVYQALVDPNVIERWRAPDGMTALVHEFDGREGGTFRVSLTYDAPTDAGKTTARTDTYHGHFAVLVADERIVEVMAFETDDPRLGGEMTLTTTLGDGDGDGGTIVVMTHDGIPPGVSAADNELGTRMALDKLAALLEAGV
jgi:uncharacterized protein YndB with AHSA1/START domain